MITPSAAASKVIALVHEKPDDIPLGKSEKDLALREAADF